MIREFWQERKEEKKKLKQQKKEHRKLPKTREQIAYKIFGFCFAIFLIIGSIGYACRSTNSDNKFSWESVIGITEDMKTALTTRVNERDVVSDPIGIADWSDCKDILAGAGLSNIIIDGKVDRPSLEKSDSRARENFSMNNWELGALLQQLISVGDYSKYLQLKQLDLIIVDNELYLVSIMYMDLSMMIMETTLPNVYVKSTSIIDILENRVTALSTQVQINNIENELNDKIVDTINKSSYFEIAYFTNTHIVSQINYFAQNVDVYLRINGKSLQLDKIN